VISYRDALANATVPALLVGPMLGAAGAGVLMTVSGIVNDGGSAGIVVFAMLVGCVVGLMGAGPICLLAGALLVWLASRNRAWEEWWRSGAAGALVGAITGALYALVEQSEPQPSAVVGMTMALGALGGFVFRRLINRQLHELRTSDSEVFG
jgi:hypothetical protein